MAVLIYSVWKFRSPPEDESDGPSIHGHTGLEIAWTVVPAILVIAIGVLSAVVLSQNGNAGTNPMTIKVFAQQFAWRFEYPDNDGVKSGELVLPVDRNITFELESADVIHSFWIPAMGQKQDVVPGNRHEHRRHADAHGHVRAHLHRALRPRPRHDARRRPRCRAGGLRRLGRGAEGRQRQAAPTAAAVFASAGCGGCHAFAPGRDERRDRARASTTSRPPPRRPGEDPRPTS